MESIFSVASRCTTRAGIPGHQGRGGALKMYWTKPGPVSAGEASVYPNRRVNGTIFEPMGIESFRGSVVSMGYRENKIIGRTLGRTR